MNTLCIWLAHCFDLFKSEFKKLQSFICMSYVNIIGANETRTSLHTFNLLALYRNELLKKEAVF